MVRDRACGGVRGAGVGRDVDLLEAGPVADRAVGDDARRAARVHPRGQDVAERARADLVARVDHQHVAGPDRLDRDALHVGPVVEVGLERQVLAHRDIAQGEGVADHPQLGAHRDEAGQEGVAQAALEQLAGQRGGADPAQGLLGRWREIAGRAVVHRRLLL